MVRVLNKKLWFSKQLLWDSEWAKKWDKISAQSCGTFCMASTLCYLLKYYITIEALLLLKDKEETVAHSFHFWIHGIDTITHWVNISLIYWVYLKHWTQPWNTLRGMNIFLTNVIFILKILDWHKTVYWLASLGVRWWFELMLKNCIFFHFYLFL